MKQIIIVGLLSLFTIFVNAQEQKVDSLIHVLNTEELSSDKKLNLLDRVCDMLIFNDPQQAFDFAQKGLLLALEEKNTLMASYFNEFMGISYGVRNKKDSSLVYLEKALDFALKAKDEKQQTKLYINLGVTNHGINEFTKSLEYYMEALKLAEKTGSRQYEAMALGNMGTIHLHLLNKTRAKELLERARLIAEEANFTQAKIRAYCDLADIYREEKEYTKATDYAWKTVCLCEESGNKNFHTTALVILAATYYELGDQAKALECADKALKIAEEFGDPKKIQTALMRLSDIYLKEGRYEECEAAASRALAIDSTELRTRILLFNLGMANLHLGKMDKATYYLWEHREKSKLIADKNYQDALMNMEVKYETEKKELQITSLEKERHLYIWLGGIGLLLAVALGTVLWQKTKNARKEKQLIATRSVLDGEMGERTRLARDLHDRLSGNLSALKIGLNDNSESLNMISGKLDHCIEELRRVAHNLMPSSLQYGMKVALEDFTAQFPQVHFHFFGEEKRIEERKEFIIYCCANELVTNSLRHSGAEIINVQLVQDEKHVTLTVQDDGCGYDENAVQKGIGLKSIYDRVVSCNGKIDVVTSPGKGTETTIEISS